MDKVELVFLEPGKADAEPFTTSEVVANFSGVSHKKIKRAITKYKPDLEAFGILVPYETEINREETRGRKATGFILNEPQATFLLTLLKNTPVVVAFKKELVRQFYAMREALTDKRIAREAYGMTRHSLTDTIRDCLPGTPHKSMQYKNYTDLAYRTALGKTAAQIRKERGAAKNSVAADFLNASELACVERVLGHIDSMIALQFNYADIKAALVRALPA